MGTGAGAVFLQNWGKEEGEQTWESVRSWDLAVEAQGAGSLL